MDTALKPNKRRHCISFSWRLFLSVIALFIAFSLCFIAYQYQREKEYKVELLDMQLQDYNERLHIELHYLSDSLRNNKLADYITRHINKDLRVTVINLQGKVLYDNCGDSLYMENHIGRPEIQKALRDGKGYDVRRISETTGVTYFYSATLYDKFIIRSALPYDLNLLQNLSADSHYIWFTVTITLMLIFLFYRYTARLGRRSTNCENSRSVQTKTNPSTSTQTSRTTSWARFPATSCKSTSGCGRPRKHCTSSARSSSPTCKPRAKDSASSPRTKKKSW